MKEYYVHCPSLEVTSGYIATSDVIRAENALEATLRLPLCNEDFSLAIPVPQEMRKWDKERILKYYEELREEVGDNNFYIGIMDGILPRYEQDMLKESEEIFRRNGNLKPEWYLKKQEKDIKEYREKLEKI